MYKIVKKTKYGWTNIARKLKVFNRRFSTENEEKFNIAIDEKLKVDDEDPNEIYVNKKLMNANLNFFETLNDEKQNERSSSGWLTEKEWKKRTRRRKFPVTSKLVPYFFNQKTKPFSKTAINSLLQTVHYHNVLDTNVLYDFDILDLHCGPGLLAQQIFKRDNSINMIACDPVLENRVEFSNRTPGCPVTRGSSSKIPLRNGCVKSVIVCNEFHKFANEKSLNEISRVLVQGGRLGLIWRRLDTTIPWIQEIEDIISPYYSQSDLAIKYGTWKSAFENNNKFNPLNVISSMEMPEVRYDIGVSLDRVINYVRGRSAIRNIKCDETELNIIDEKVTEIFDRTLHDHYEYECDLIRHSDAKDIGYDGVDFDYSNAEHDQLSLLRKREKKFAYDHYFIDQKLELRFVFEIYWVDLITKPKITL